MCTLFKEADIQRAMGKLCDVSRPLTLFVQIHLACHPLMKHLSALALGSINTKKGSFDFVFMVMHWKLDWSEGQRFSRTFPFIAQRLSIVHNPNKLHSLHP